MRSSTCLRAACLFVAVALVAAASPSLACAQSITCAGNKFVSPMYGNCFSPLGTYTLANNWQFDHIEVEIKQKVNGQDQPVPAYPGIIRATTNGTNWSSPTFTNLPGNMTYVVYVRLYGHTQNNPNPVQIADANQQFPF